MDARELGYMKDQDKGMLISYEDMPIIYEEWLERAFKMDDGESLQQYKKRKEKEEKERKEKEKKGTIIFILLVIVAIANGLEIINGHIYDMHVMFNNSISIYIESLTILLKILKTRQVPELL